MKQLVVLISVLLVVGTMGVFGCAPPASAPAPSPAPQPSPSPAPAPSSVTPAPTVSPAAKPAAQPVKPVEIKIVNWNALAKEMQYSAWDMIERLEKKSNGALKFKLLGGIEVIAGLEQYEAVQKGVVDLVWVPAGYVKGILPEAPMVGLSRMTSQERRAKGIYSILNELHQKRNVY